MSEPNEQIRVTVVTGFLGSGKSTLLRRWLRELPGGETAVIVNERGAVGIDGELLAAHVSRLREITGGCVCCSNQAELISALKEMSESAQPPRRILVETSGAASPAGVIRGVTAPRMRERMRLDGVVTVVDVTRARTALEFDVGVEQLGFADVVVLSHMDETKGLADVDLQAIRAELQQRAPAAVFAEADRGDTRQSLLSLLEARTEALSVPGQGVAHSSIDAVALVLEGELDEDRFTDWVETTLGAIEGRVLRLKGILAIQNVDARVIVQGVAGAVEVEVGSAWESSQRRSRLVILGLGLDADELEAGFRRCASPV